MRNLVSFFFISLLCACAPARFVKPLADEQKAASLSLGGPLFDFSNLIIPMPLLTAAYGYGIDSTLTGFGALNITSALYGNAQVELGITKRILQQHGHWPALSIAPVANVIYRNKEAFKFYPQVDVNAYWDFNRSRNYFYAGISNWFDLAGKRAHEEKQTHHWLLTPQLGQTFVRRRWDFTIEAKIIAPHIASDKNAVDYKTPLGKHGAFGIYFGYTRKF
ncbi:MAG: hypothetical protein ICV81_18875 [Flavisolibacter sp.]|nr:hypothetical protein [Flavisolibacter sp.]MBD0350416.1 hypothetical protein [Flavisolibacter sp.]